jgi:hypothetical protein
MGQTDGKSEKKKIHPTGNHIIRFKYNFYSLKERKSSGHSFPLP